MAKFGRKLKLNNIKKRFILNNPKSLLLYGIIKKVYAYTMLSYDSLYQIYECIKNIDKEEVDGALVEMGSWNGGGGALMSWCTKNNKSNREIWLFDSFEGLPELSEEDREWADKSNLKIRENNNVSIKSSGYYSAKEESVREILKRLSVEKNVHIVKGWFQETLPMLKRDIGRIAVLRLDGDIYESTKFCLEELYDLVSLNGYIIIDDYNLGGCRRALYEFFYKRNISPYIYNNLFAGRAYFKKTI